ncbi:MAG: metallopeptidase family protein [Candidatus Nealsonbacteria bacterium]
MQSDSDFEKLVKEALSALPKRILERMDNVAIVIEKRPTRSQFLGLYQGVPQNAWGRSFGMRLPDKITIFQESLERAASSEKELKEIVRDTVWHEIAHHFGFDERKVRELEAKWRKKRIK